jgi:hypothetical protein
MRTALWLCVALMATSLPLDGGDGLKISVLPAYSFAPATLQDRVRLEPNAENRALEIVAECDDFYRSSEIAVDGERGPATIEFKIRSAPAGAYQVVAVLKDQAGRPRATAARQVTVIGLE